MFVAPDYPERVAKQLVDKHARAVESMASDGACRARCNLRRFLPPPLLLLVLCPTTSAHHIRPLARRVPRPRVAAAAGCWLTVATLSQAPSTRLSARSSPAVPKRRTKPSARHWRRSASPLPFYTAFLLDFGNNCGFENGWVKLG